MIYIVWRNLEHKKVDKEISVDIEKDHEYGLFGKHGKEKS